MDENLSAIAEKRTQAPSKAEAANTGLSPEFHFASFNIGRAGSFWRPLLRSDLLSSNQSVKSHLSNDRLSFLAALDETGTFVSVALFVAALNKSISVELRSDESEALSSSKYSFISPRRLLIASFVLETGTTCSAQTLETTTQRMTIIPKPTKLSALGIIGSKTVPASTEKVSAPSINEVENTGEAGILPNLVGTPSENILRLEGDEPENWTNAQGCPVMLDLMR
jgi:hypothetical protein